MLGLEEVKGLVFGEKPHKGSVEPTSLVDRSRWGNDGTHTAITMVQLPSGLWVRSFVNASNSKVTITDHISLKPPVAYAFGCWAYFDTVSGNQYLMSKGGEGVTGAGYSIRRVGTSVFAYIYNAAGDRQDLAGIDRTVAVGTWYHIIITVTGSAYFGYLNGAETFTDATVVGVKHLAGDMLIGRRQDDVSGTLDGDIGLPFVKSYAPNAAWARALFDKQKHLFGIGRC